MVKKQDRYWKARERQMGEICSDADVLWQPVEEDENGWDGIVEFPAPAFEGPADRRPSWLSAYVQVKSSQGRTPATRTKLSNVLKSAQHSSPWFIILFWRPQRGEIRVFAKHIWEGELARGLAAVRKADVEGVRLHKRYLRYTFSDADDHTDDLVTWMHRCIADVGGPDYDLRKRAAYSTVGYEDGYGTANMTIVAKDIDEMDRNFLGIGKGLEVTRFHLTEDRFGIPQPQPEFEFSKAILHIEPTSSELCEVWVSSGIAHEPMVLMGEVIPSPLGVFSPGRRVILFKTSVLRIFWRANEVFRFEVDHDLSQPASLKDIETISRLLHWGSRGPLTISVRQDDETLLEGHTNPYKADPFVAWSNLADAASLLNKIAQRDLSMKAIDLIDNGDVGVVTGMFARSSLKFRPSGKPGKRTMTHLIYYAALRCGGHGFFALAERRVASLADDEDGGGQVPIFGPPRIVDAFFAETPTAVHDKRIHELYERLITATEEGGGAVFGARDVVHFFRAVTTEDADYVVDLSDNLMDASGS
ncbi:MAG TPA: hypothetical protein VMF90_08640 [Rhizobiaceae bacterium]|nr:hypothetical protein [Rhizobiaceae bacterium]